MNTKRTSRLIGLAGFVAVAVFLVVAASSCSGGDDSEEATSPPEADAVTASSPTATPTPGPPPTATPTPGPTPTATPLPTPTPTPTPDPEPVGQTGEWNLVFDDTFDTIDTSIWETGWFSSSGFSPAVNGNGAACFHPDQLAIDNGNLVVTVETEDDDDCRLKDGSGAGYVAGLINTRETFTFSYGYAEARMFLASDGGPLHNWPAFWHTGFDWPRTGEVDIAEGLSEGALCSVYHHQGADGEHVQERGCVDWEDPGGWHVFGADWQPDRITFYYDGVEVFSTAEGVVDSPHYLIVDYTVHNDGSAVVPSEMLVDYVRVWQR